MWGLMGMGAGFFMWGLEEYLAHRFLFHHPSPRLGKRHLAHHQNTRDLPLTFAKWPLVVMAILAEGGILALVFPIEVASGVAFGLLMGYANYEWTHYSDHFRTPRSNRAKRLRQHHFIHHFRDSGRAFGVTTLFWDRVFGTLPPAPQPPRAERAGSET